MRERYDDEMVRLCTQVGGDMHFPRVGHREEVKAAKAVCSLCEVRKACLTLAMKTGERYGVWGGKSGRERREERVRRRSASFLSQTP